MQLIIPVDVRNGILRHLDHLMYSGRAAPMDIAPIRDELLRLQAAPEPPAPEPAAPETATNP